MIQEKVVDEKSKWTTIKFYKAKSTKDNPSGYKGRVGIYEVLEVSEKIREAIIKRASPDDINKIAQEDGMLSMLEDGFVKAATGQTTIEEILRVTKE